MIIGIDKGHRYGTGAARILNETTENRKIGNELIKMLKEHGHTVIDCTSELVISTSQLGDIVRKANAQKLDIFCSIHLNAGGGHGTETFLCSGNYAGKEENRKIAQRVNDEIVKSCNFRNRGVKENTFYVIKNTIAPAILIEVCFVDSIEDKSKYDYLKVAKAIFKGLTGKEYAPKVTPTPTPSTNVSTIFKVGDTVTVSKNATHYATGQTMASFVKGNTYTIKEVKSDKALLSGIISWVYFKDLIGQAPQFKSYTVKITTDVLNVRKGPATSYAVSTTVKKNQVFTIVEEKNGWGKLKSGAGWISLEYTSKN